MAISKKKQRKKQNLFLFLIISLAVLLVVVLILWKTVYLHKYNKNIPDPSSISQTSNVGKVEQSKSFSYNFYLFKNMSGVKSAGYNLNSNPIEIYLTLKRSFNVENFIGSLQKILYRTDAKIISWKSLDVPEKKIKIFMTMNRKELLLKVGWKERKINQIVAKQSKVSDSYNNNPIVKQGSGSKKNILKQNGRKTPSIAIVLDDAGGLGSSQWKFLGINAKLTFAVMPDLVNSIKFARLAHSKGYNVILHAPMMPRAQSREAIPMRVIRSGMSRSAVFAMLESFFSFVPYARGMNNHMGSLATSNSQLMGYVMSYLKKKSYFFFDSFTHASSIAYSSAIRHGLTGYRRDIFLDHHRDYKYIENSLYRLAKLAVKKGFAIGIGHVTSLNTYRVLLANIPKIKKLGIKFIYLMGRH